jgi:hypothetical protein
MVTRRAISAASSSMADQHHLPDGPGKPPPRRDGGHPGDRQDLAAFLWPLDDPVGPQKEQPVSDPAENPGNASERDPVLGVRAHLEQALAALDQLREILPGASQPEHGGKS